MVIFDSYKNHLSVQFEQFYKEKCIIIIYLFIYFSYFIQPLDIDCFNMLKQSHNRDFKDFIKTYINYITKTKFFIIFKVVHFNIITSENIKISFQNAGLIPYNLQAIISKFDIKL